MITTDKAYLLGLIIGGGDFGNAEDVFRIRLPYKKWGSYLENPQRAGKIAGDILKKVSPMFKAIYNLSIQYEATAGGVWTILCEGDISSVKEDFNLYGITCEGELRGNTNINGIIPYLVDDNLKRRFIAGLADTIGSMAKSQRRFSEEHQIISFEIKGYNFQFVCDLCRLLYDINCIPDQINWNHPNIHCTSNPHYLQWNKGFKLRILLDQYAKFGAFAFRTKAETSNLNRQLQKEQHSAERCETRDFNVTPSTIHPAENDARLPDEIRGGHYIHFRHFCAVLGCEHAPYGKIKSCFKELGNLVIPFPILLKDTYSAIKQYVNADPLLANRKYNVSNIIVSSLVALLDRDKNTLIYGSNLITGYPITKVLQGIAYIIADDSELNGTRTRGNYIDLIKEHLQKDNILSVEVHRPDLLTPLIITGNGRGVMVGAVNPSVYRSIIKISPDSEYKLLVRKITEEDLTVDK